MNKRDKILRILRYYKKNQEYRIELLADDILALDQPQEEKELNELEKKYKWNIEYLKKQAQKIKQNELPQEEIDKIAIDKLKEIGMEEPQEGIKKYIEKRKLILKNFIERYNLDIDKHRLKELEQLELEQLELETNQPQEEIEEITIEQAINVGALMDVVRKVNKIK